MRYASFICSRISILGLLLGSSLAMADVVAVVSSKSAVMTMSKSQVADIFLGKTSHFPGGGEAVPIDQIEGSAARDAFYDKVVGKSGAQLRSYWSKIIFTGRGQPPLSVSTSLELRKRIAENPTLIGYIDSGLVDGSLRVVL